MTINSHLITKSVLQSKTREMLPVSAVKASAALAYEGLKEASWRAVSSLSSSTPPHDRTQTGFNEKYVACAYSGDYDEDTGKQHVYACAAAYTIHIPADALTGDPCYIASLNLRLFTDQWLVQGVNVKAFISDSLTLPTWEDILVGSNGNFTIVTNSVAGQNILFPEETAVDTYIHLIVFLRNYEAVNGEMVEGSAMLIDDSISITYSRSVVADTFLTLPVFPLRMIAYPRLEIGEGVVFSSSSSSLYYYHTTNPSLFDRSTAAGRELAIKQALLQFPYDAKSGSFDLSANSGAGVEYMDVEGDTDDVRVYGTVMGMYYHTSSPRVVSRFTILTGMPGLAETGWHNGLYIRWTLYHVAGSWVTEYLTNASLTDPLFWQGRATTLLMGVASSEVTASPVASFLMPNGGYANGDSIPITPTLLDTRGTFILVWYPEEVTDFEIPDDLDTFYGMSIKTPNNIPEALYFD